MFRTLQLASPPIKGDDVLRAQRLLAKNKFGAFDPGDVDGEWGSLCHAATRRAQYWLGRKKSALDGVYREQFAEQLAGTRKLSAIQALRRRARLHKKARAGATTVGSRAFAYAVKEVGVKEDPPGSNDGPRVRQYQSATGAYRAPWCASFVSWCLDKGGGFKRDRSVNWAYCPSILAAARDGRASLSMVKTPRQGDLVLFDWERNGVADHIGFVDGPSGDGGWRTIEGNTSSDAAGSQSNGGLVARKIRYSAEIAGFVRCTKNT